MIRLANNPQARLPPQLVAHARLFAFAITALVVFLGGLCFWPTAIRGYVTQASIALRAEQLGTAITHLPSRKNQDDVRDVVLSAETLRAALREAGPPSNVVRNKPGEFPQDAEVEFVRRNLSVGRDSTAEDEGIRLLLSYTGNDSDWSVSFLDRLAEQTIVALDQRAAEEIALAMAGKTESPLALVERREEAARAALDGFLSRHFDTLNQTETSRGGSNPKVAAAPTDSQPRPATPSPSPKTINPKWKILDERLAAEVAKRDQLLLDRLPEHPQVREASVRIDAVQRQLEQTPKYLGDESLPPAGQSTALRKSQNAVQPAQFILKSGRSFESCVFDIVPEVGDEYERLLGELSKAREARKAAEREAEILSLTARAQAPTTVLRGKIVANARLAQTLRQGPSTGRLTVLALASIFAGACVAALIRIPGKSEAYSTVAEVEADLSLSVVGVVATASPSPAALSR